MLFFGVPLGHSEELDHQELSVQLMDRLIKISPPSFVGFWTFPLKQRANTAMSSGDLADIRIGTNCLDASQRQRSWSTLPRLTLHILALFADHSTCVVSRMERICRPSRQTISNAQHGTSSCTPTRQIILFMSFVAVCLLGLRENLRFTGDASASRASIRQLRIPTRSTRSTGSRCPMNLSGFASALTTDQSPRSCHPHRGRATCTRFT
jgi:hypothetical protein